MSFRSLWSAASVAFERREAVGQRRHSELAIERRVIRPPMGLTKCAARRTETQQALG
jgi:hypothetical protein